ncbi:succinate dehydrogenase/fumarate reductase flavoprotein subunit [Mariniflexile fucanivorans]|uniref:Succinate dehydrogenase/fumarate reductase flavoprotein subunit n=1 Tax=Mariniflexile fucanivorans TaxID=264023 RepID=A0A4R1RL40_9FLAO|nr:FAD-binding protein [Mariniflexile fucanivorans]TCL66925.1 succinate dehydrogenase/fumarate reductase flavoprotein subunit [Mariniflexile fucanivorans]
MKTETNNLSRRKFIALAGGGVGFAAIAGLGMNIDWALNNPEIDADTILKNTINTDVLVVGGGMAGLFAAVKAHDAGAKVMLVSKGRLGASGQTPFAKGIFAYDKEKEKLSIDEFVAKVSRSALGTNNQTYTRQLAEHSLARVNELKEWGFFESSLYNKSFSKPIEERNIPMHERVTITHLIKEDDRVVGAAGFSIDEQKVLFYQAKSVILCTGAGGFKPNGFPICDLTHDGTVMAYNIGAKVTGKEWNDGHPARGENPAACYDGWGDMFEQKPSTTSIEVRHDLGVDMNYMAYMSGGVAQMGRPGMGKQENSVSGGPYRPEEFSSEKGQGGPSKDGEKDGKRPPRKDGEDRPPRKEGEDGPPGKEGKGGPPGMGGGVVGGSSAGMSIHKAEGLVPINDTCESTIPGLYAAGDALGSYMAGGIYTQIGSSLSGSAVQGAIAGETAAKYSKNIKAHSISASKLNAIEEDILAPLKKEAGYSPAWVTQTLQSIMIPNFIIYIKKENLMKAALAYVEELRDHHVPHLRASNLHELRLAHETKNMVISAEMKLRASLMRKESRCSHYRLDYPELDNENWQAWINIFKAEDGTMQLEKQPFNTWATVETNSKVEFNS